MSTCTFPTLRTVSRATPGASASDSPRHHHHHHNHYHYQQPVKGVRGDIVASPVTWTRGAGEPIEGRGGRCGGGMGAHRQSWRLSASSPAEHYIGHKLTLCYPWFLACEGNAFLHYNLTWRSRYWKLCGEGSGRPPRSEDPLDPPLESGRCGGNHSEGDNSVGIVNILLGGYV